MTKKKTPSLVTVLLWVVGLAVAADIVIVVIRHPKVPEIPTSQVPVATVSEISATTVPSPPPAPALAAPVTKGASNEPLSTIDLSTSEGLESFRQQQMAQLRKQAKGDIGDPTRYHASEEDIRIMESNKVLVW